MPGGPTRAQGGAMDEPRKVVTRSVGKSLGPQVLVVPEDPDAVRVSWVTTADHQAFQSLLDHTQLASWKEKNPRDHSTHDLITQQQYLRSSFGESTFSATEDGPNWILIWDYLLSLSGPAPAPANWEGMFHTFRN